ncbi:MAG: hypothetical protein LAO06_06510 [Acidobacteriia bacterium]|nr:hypothetical protein [Terriglobia bacterium]
MRSRITMTVVLAAAVFFLMSGASFAQGWQWGQGEGWHFQGHSDAAYDRGVRDGRYDREHGRGWHPHNDGQAYLNGYRAGYGRDGGSPGRDRNDGYRGSGPYGPGGNNAQSVAYNNGFREGVGYGQSDRNNGHSYRPTYSSTYQNGHSGYNSSYGSQTAYKHAFQDGFRAGYDRGYNGGGVRR